MVAPAQSQQPPLLSERLLITRIITSLGVALLLVLGVWASTHGEPGEAGAIAASVVDVSYEQALPVDVDGTSGPLWAEVIFGATACLLGVLCGLVLIALMFRLLRQLSPTGFTIAPRVRFRLRALSRPRATVLTLAQLGLSRT